jgi:hypothetical protein
MNIFLLRLSNILFISWSLLKYWWILINLKKYLWFLSVALGVVSSLKLAKLNTFIIFITNWSTKLHNKSRGIILMYNIFSLLFFIRWISFRNIASLVWQVINYYILIKIHWCVFKLVVLLISCILLIVLNLAAIIKIWLVL